MKFRLHFVRFSLLRERDRHGFRTSLGCGKVSFFWSDSRFRGSILKFPPMLCVAGFDSFLAKTHVRLVQSSQRPLLSARFFVGFPGIASSLYARFQVVFPLYHQAGGSCTKAGRISERYFSGTCTVSSRFRAQFILSNSSQHGAKAARTAILYSQTPYSRTACRRPKGRFG